MITGVTVVTVIVRDLAAAHKFYTEKLGFQTKTDMNLGGNRWVTVIPEGGAGPEVLLFNPRDWMDPAAAESMLDLIGKMPGHVLGTDDCRKTIADLQAKGVQILREPAEEPYGIEAVFADLFGNPFVVTELKQK